MMTEGTQKQKRLMYVDLDEFVPANHLLRQIEQEINLSFVYDLVRPLYSSKGRPSVDPLLLVKMLLLGYLYGITSERKLEQEVRMNLAYRWFLHLELDEAVPDHSTLSQNRRRRFKSSNVFQEIFDRVVHLCIDAGLVTGETLLSDSTHIRASAANHRFELVTVDKTPTEYMQVLEQEAQRLDAEHRAAHPHKGKKRGSKPKAGPRKPTQETVKRSTTDPDSGFMNRPKKPTGFHYLCNMTLDPQYGIITDVHVTPGNTNDHLPYPARIAAQKEKFKFPLQWAGADKGFDYLSVHYALHLMGITPVVPSIARAGSQKAFGPFTYDAEADTYICPAGKAMPFTHIDQYDKDKVYAASTADCQRCPFRNECLVGKHPYKRVKRPLHQDLSDKHHELDGTPQYYEVQRLRRIWCEGTFALMKEQHNLRSTRKRGTANLQEQCLLSALAVNLKRFVQARGRPRNPFNSLRLWFTWVRAIQKGLRAKLSTPFVNSPNHGRGLLLVRSRNNSR